MERSITLLLENHTALAGYTNRDLAEQQFQAMITIEEIRQSEFSSRHPDRTLDPSRRLYALQDVLLNPWIPELQRISGMKNVQEC